MHRNISIHWHISCLHEIEIIFLRKYGEQNTLATKSN